MQPAPALDRRDAADVFDDPPRGRIMGSPPPRTHAEERDADTAWRYLTPQTGDRRSDVVVPYASAVQLHNVCVTAELTGGALRLLRHLLDRRIVERWDAELLLFGGDEAAFNDAETQIRDFIKPEWDLQDCVTDDGSDRALLILVPKGLTCRFSTARSLRWR